MLVLTSFIFYFPTTMLLMYCYVLLYHLPVTKAEDEEQKGTIFCSSLIDGSTMANRPIELSQEADNTASLIRSLSAISLMFIIVVTPRSILQVITSVTMEQVSMRYKLIISLIFLSATSIC